MALDLLLMHKTDLVFFIFVQDRSSLSLLLHKTDLFLFIVEQDGSRSFIVARDRS